MSHNEIVSFHKDRKGFPWIGTASGLNRFDGYTPKVFQQKNSRDTTSLSSNSIPRIFETPDGRLGILTADTFNIYDPALERFQRNTAAFYKTYNIPPGRLWDMMKDASEISGFSIYKTE